jgi:hypothetical protein
MGSKAGNRMRHQKVLFRLSFSLSCFLLTTAMLRRLAWIDASYRIRA